MPCVISQPSEQHMQDRSTVSSMLSAVVLTVTLRRTTLSRQQSALIATAINAQLRARPPGLASLLLPLWSRFLPPQLGVVAHVLAPLVAPAVHVDDADERLRRTRCPIG